MSRKKISNQYKIIKKKQIITGAFLINSLIGKLIKKGKKILIKKILKFVIQNLEKKLQIPFSLVLEKAVKNVSPKFKVCNLKKNSTLQNDNLLGQKVIELNKFEATKISLSWLIKGAKERKMNNIIEALTFEILEAFKGKGNAIRYRLEWYQKVKLLKNI